MKITPVFLLSANAQAVEPPGAGGKGCPQSFSECNFRFVRIREIGLGAGKLSAESVRVLRIYTHLLTESTELCFNIKIYVTIACILKAHSHSKSEGSI